jgi:hypothetical protein
MVITLIKELKKHMLKNRKYSRINFILIRMLKLAGISVNPVLLSTIEHGVPVFSLIEQF